MSAPATHQPDWYPDPSGARRARWWDGNAWTEHTGPSHLARTPPSGGAPGRRELTSGGLTLGLAAAALVVGSLMPWVSVRFLLAETSMSGIEGDGQITLVAGVAVGAAALYYYANRRLPEVAVIGAGLASAVAGGVAVYDLVRIEEAAAEVNSGVVSASAGPGLFVCGLGAFVGLIGACVVHGELQRLRQRAAVGQS